MKNNQHSLIGKIARLPKVIREQLNRRLDDGQPARDILPWLNALPPVQKILAAQFRGAPINKQNLSKWRLTGFRRWQDKQAPLARLADLREDASDISHAARGWLARGAAAVAAAQILDFLKSIPPNKRSARDAIKAAAAITAFLKADQNHVRLKLERQKVRQKDEQIQLMRDKHQRDVIAIGRRLLQDERAKLIEFGPFSNEEKIELLGLHIFGELWVPRLLPSSKPQLKSATPAASKPAGEDGSSSSSNANRTKGV